MDAANITCANMVSTINPTLGGWVFFLLLFVVVDDVVTMIKESN